ncbi:MAG TPA: hypothetical protein VMU88_07755, partial [bacterium]|nr:hypothetical protein [bacterium]
LLWALAALLNRLAPRLFFPDFTPQEVAALSGAGTLLFGAWAWGKARALRARRREACRRIEAILQKRNPPAQADENEVMLAGRVVARLARNADEDLREIDADFSPESLGRLDAWLPLLLDEIQTEEDALIRLGVVGTYLGEVLCRHRGWRWFFKPDPALRQFSYLPSLLRRGERQLDPYAWAGELFRRRKRAAALLGEAQ